MRTLIAFFLFCTLLSCRDTSEADLLIYNARIYTVDSSFTVAEAMAIKEGKILEVGTTVNLTRKYFSRNKVNAQGKFIYPGFIDAHAHFYRYGLGLQTANLVGTTSWEDILTRLDSFAAKNSEGWLIGRGWDQNDWALKEFPTREKLDQLFPSRPVLLTRVDGHAAIANQVALDAANINAGMQLTGGQVEVKNGKLTGLLIDNAVDLVSSRIPAPSSAQIKKALDLAQQNCFAVGLTTVDDCGLDYSEVLMIDSLQKKGDLKMRIYAMLSDAPHNYDFLFGKGKIKTDYLNVRSFKVYADGALGSRGACLLKPYTDRPGWHGFLLSTPQHFDSVASILNSKGFQMCTHAIGDSGNRLVLDIYGKYLKGKNDKRWRIEHAQVVNEADFAKFEKYSIIPSVQPTHATSDMYWAGERLGKEREKGAYAYWQLMQQNGWVPLGTDFSPGDVNPDNYQQLVQRTGWIPLGTDFPVEDISPFKTFYAAVYRQDEKGFPKYGYQPGNALSREAALRGMTIWAARSNFEEEEKGSLEKGKLADFVVLDRDLLTVAPKEVLKTTVLATYVGGTRVYGQ